ncbi:hypothetical protein THAOC_24270, partial [Thalassiosira oceanica]
MSPTTTLSAPISAKCHVLPTCRRHVGDIANIAQIQQVYGAMDPLLAYTLAPMHLSAFDIPRGNFGVLAAWHTSNQARVYGAMNPLVAYTLAPMHLPAFHIPRGSGKTTWEPTSSSIPTATPCL